MELEDLKDKWRELDKRLECADEKMEKLTTEVAAGKFTSAKQRLARILRLQIFLLTTLPFSYVNISRLGLDPGTAVSVFLALFVLAMLARQVFLLVSLARIDPATQSVRDACTAVLWFRSCFLVGVGVGIVLAVPLLISLGIYVGSLTNPYTFYGFLGGLIVGLPLGVRIFMRSLGEVNAMRASLQDTRD